MPLSPAQPDAVARIYAQSLLQLAEQQGGAENIESIVAELGEIVEIARGDAKFAEFLASRVLPTEQRQASLKRIFEGNASDLTTRFLLVLNAKERLAHLPAIVAALDEAVQERFGRVEVDVYTASPIDPEGLSTLRDRLAATLKKEVVVHPYTDRAMLGGVKLRIGDQLIDGSLSTRLRAIRDQLATHGQPAVRAAAGRIVTD